MGYVAQDSNGRLSRNHQHHIHCTAQLVRVTVQQKNDRSKISYVLELEYPKAVQVGGLLGHA